MSTLGFEEYVEPLKLYLHKYREVSFKVLGGNLRSKLMSPAKLLLRKRNCERSKCPPAVHLVNSIVLQGEKQTLAKQGENGRKDKLDTY